MGRRRYQEDVTGQRFGQLVAVRLDRNDAGHLYWLFDCDCGKQAVRRLSDVRRSADSTCGHSGGFQSGGFQKGKRTRTSGQGFPDNCRTPARDLSGQILGGVLVLAPAPKGSNKNPRWLYSCLACGNERTATSGHLLSGKYGSCGCLRGQRVREARAKRYEVELAARKKLAESVGRENLTAKQVGQHRRDLLKPFAEPYTKQEIWERDGGACHICLDPCSLEDATMDHLWPVSFGGPDRPSNVKTAHRSCNSKKHARIKLSDDQQVCKDCGFFAHVVSKEAGCPSKWWPIHLWMDTSHEKYPEWDYEGWPA